MKIRITEIQYSLQKIGSHSTGSCICLIYEDNRCCFANIGASKHFTSTFLTTTDDLPNLNSSVQQHNQQQIFYIEGFFVSDRMQVCYDIYEQFFDESNNADYLRLFAANLSAEYIIKNYSEAINYLAYK